MPGTVITAHFGADNQLTGSSGCNEYASAFAAGEGDLSVALPTATLRSCEDPSGVMLQEANFLANLVATRTYALIGDELWLGNADGGPLLLFVADQG
jgi:heat shock protein HslJ